MTSMSRLHGTEVAILTPVKDDVARGCIDSCAVSAPACAFPGSGHAAGILGFDGFVLFGTDEGGFGVPPRCHWYRACQALLLIFRGGQAWGEGVRRWTHMRVTLNWSLRREVCPPLLSPTLQFTNTLSRRPSGRIQILGKPTENCQNCLTAT
jgi:hypothetical protein